MSGANITLVTEPKYHLPHARSLNLTFDDDSVVKIWLEQGFGYWFVNKNTNKKAAYDEVLQRRLLKLFLREVGLLKPAIFQQSFFLN
ncbi:hypothetical protein [Shewanella sp. 4_MG-2023]|uniref:hypothetical protein n=1 Tax=Shewanella sp. 4_MG-2023 TaxID=3062652 RepID=UPI0026E12E1A|nr:hypothetical protein [Shewanella sp. 4_MG-2023]MDO6678441.1 hypothetical protein [Shewanella sp. 4_MG-2023]